MEFWRGTGSLYRLILPEGSTEQSATEYVSRDGRQVVIFAFLRSSPERYPYPTLKLKGLDEDATYKLAPFEGKAVNGTPSVGSGAYWMDRGLDPSLNGEYQAAGFTLEKVTPAQ
jgi:alpha-galactosidase